MITDQDIDRLKAVFATAAEVAALRTSVTELLDTLVYHERQVAGSDAELTELVGTLSPQAEISQAFDLAALRAELERLKQVLREQLHLDL
jgi:hypothetical protein